MTADVTIRFKYFRSFFLVGFLANGMAMFATAVTDSPLFSDAAAWATLVFALFCIRCPNCGKSPFILIRGTSHIGSPIPERTCSRCGTTMLVSK